MVNVEVTGMNCWSDCKDGFIRACKEQFPLQLIIHNSLRMQRIFELLDNMTYQSICYISLTKTYDSIVAEKEYFKKDFFVVDCVTKGLFSREDTSTCRYELPIHSLQEIKGIIESLLIAKPFDCIVIDAISQFTSLTNVHGEDSAFSQTVASLFEHYKIPLILLHDDFRSPRIKYLPRLYIPSILRVEIFEDIIDWKD